MTVSKILCVDDDPRVLNGLRRQLGTRFDLETAEGPVHALKRIRSHGPYAVVLSDMRMPDMNGVELLREVRILSPDTVRMMLTGHADLKTTIDAVNEGNIFRFLAKPCQTGTLISALDDAIRQYGLVTAEKELVEGTLKGCVSVLSDVLALVNPLAFGRASRIRRLAVAIGNQLDVSDKWQLEIAAMLSQLGCVTIPESLLQDVFEGRPLQGDAKTLYGQHPLIAGKLLRKIPRLDRVADLVSGQLSDASDTTAESIEGRILQIASDYDVAEARLRSVEEALLEVIEKWRAHDGQLADALNEAIGQLHGLRSRQIKTVELAEGMVLAANVMTTDGRLLVAKGQEVTFSLRQRLVNFHKNGVIQEPLVVLEPEQSCDVSQSSPHHLVNA